VDSRVAKPRVILDFWFSEPANKHWFKPTPEFDEEIRIKYEAIWELASTNQLDQWQKSPEGSLALIIILDQLPLNMFRGTARSFCTEKKAIETTHYAISNQFDSKLTSTQLAFLYMPLMHSEDLQDQILSVTLFKKAGLESNLKFAKHHRSIIQRFGRFPHRNIILNRNSTADERKYLASPEAFNG